METKHQMEVNEELALLRQQNQELKNYNEELKNCIRNVILNHSCTPRQLLGEMDFFEEVDLLKVVPAELLDDRDGIILPALKGERIRWNQLPQKWKDDKGLAVELCKCGVLMWGTV
jgi:hypothetical protein